MLLLGDGGALGDKLRYSSMKPWIWRLRRTWSGSALRANTGVRWSRAVGVPVPVASPVDAPVRGRSDGRGCPAFNTYDPEDEAEAPFDSDPAPLDEAPRDAPLDVPAGAGVRTEGKWVCRASTARWIAPFRM